MIPNHTSHPDPTLDHWLDTGHKALINALDDVLDLDTGLQDIQPTPLPPTTPDQPANITTLIEYAHQLATRPAHERLATRTWFHNTNSPPCKPSHAPETTFALFTRSSPASATSLVTSLTPAPSTTPST
jgi:hypothetical protein